MRVWSFLSALNVLRSCNTSVKLINRDCNCDSIEKNGMIVAAIAFHFGRNHLLPWPLPISRFSLFRSVSRRCSLSPRYRSLWPSSGSTALSRRFHSSKYKRYYKSPRTESRRTPHLAGRKPAKISDSRSRKTIIGSCAGRPDRIEPVNQTKIAALTVFINIWWNSLCQRTVDVKWN